MAGKRHVPGGRVRLRERGAVAVEFALVLPILVMLLLGVTTVGLTYSDNLAIQNAAREASRLGAAIDYSADTDAWADAVRDRAQQVYFNGASSIADNEICVQLLDSSGSVIADPTTQGTQCGSAPATPAGISTGTCIVKVWIRKPGRIVIAVAKDLTPNLKARSVAYYGRTAGSCTAT